jgi:hypothetical protein
VLSQASEEATAAELIEEGGIEAATSKLKRTVGLTGSEDLGGRRNLNLRRNMRAEGYDVRCPSSRIPTLISRFHYIEMFLKA